MSPRDAPRHVVVDGAERRSTFTVRLPRDPAAGAAARRVVRTRLGHVVTGDTLDDVLLVVSELVSNAVLHGRGDIELRLGYDGSRVTGDVVDQGAGFVRPVHRRAHGQIGGNGLHIVDRVTSCWGIHDDAAHVWFEIPAPRTC
jgi:anti-sigma regulatory factor (Ser/Thr protein kinase)